MSEKDSKSSRGRGRGGQRGGFSSRRHESPNNFEFEPNWIECFDDFEQMDLKPELIHSIFSYGYKHPTEIQSHAIKPIIIGRSVVAQSPVVAGKTSAYAIGILQSIKIEEKTTQALVLTPDDMASYLTCELFKNIDKKMTDVHISIFRECESNQQQIEEASKNSHIVIMTPKIALKMMKKGFLQCENMKIACLDEADFILNNERINSIKEIFGYIKPEIQFLMFSPKITPQIINVMDNMMHDPVKIVAKKEQSLFEKVRQFFINVDLDNYKFDTLFNIYGQVSSQKSIIFVNKKEAVNSLKRKFEESNFEVSAIHNGLSQNEIEECIKEFITGNSRIMISTDHLLKFVHVPLMTFVINYELPDSLDLYFDRLRPASRYGREGIAINICNTSDMNRIKDIQNYFNTKIDELPFDFEYIIKDVNESITKEEY